MNKNSFLLIMSILFWGCTEEYSDTQKIVFENQSDKQFAYYFESNFGSDTLFVGSVSFKEYVNVDKVNVTSSIIGTDRDKLFPIWIIKHHEIYNITDTTSYKLNIGGVFTYSEKDSLYLKFIEKNTSSTYDKYNQTLVFRIIYNDDFPDVLTKDYSMLTKFKKYYNK